MTTDNRRTGPRRRFLAVAGGLLVVTVLSTFIVGGPPWAGPAHRGGVPPAPAVALRPAPAATVAHASMGERASSATPPWDAILRGRLHEEAPDRSGIVAITVAGRLSGPRRGSLTIVLLGLTGGGGVALQHSVVDLDLTGGGHLSGDVVALDGDTMVAAVSAGGARIELGICLRVDPSTGTVTGPVTARSALPGYGQ